MSEENGKTKTKSPRTVGVNFPRNDDGNYVFTALSLTRSDEDRSASKVVYRILKEYFEGSSDEFKGRVTKELDSSLCGVDTSPGSESTQDEFPV